MMDQLHWNTEMLTHLVHQKMHKTLLKIFFLEMVLLVGYFNAIFAIRLMLFCNYEPGVSNFI